MKFILKAVFIGDPANNISFAHFKSLFKKIPGLVKLARLSRFFANPGYRIVWRLKHDKPENLFQPYSTTKPDRYPRIFAFVRDNLTDVDRPRLLSFGCSTGAEVFTLRQYFPDAEITGIDINPHNIAVCRKWLSRSGDNLIRFEHAGSSENEPDSYYDAVFCMAVLRHGDLGSGNDAKSCAQLIRFADFERMIAGFCRCLKPGGYLAIRHSNFRFSDTEVASGFAAVVSLSGSQLHVGTPLYDRNNQRLVDAVYDDVVFRKRELS